MANRPKIPFRHGRNICIFCGGKGDTKLSEEHIWPEWAADMLPATSGHGIVAGKLDKKDLTANLHKNYKRQGAVTNFRIKQACRTCNSGWMGDYEEAVRPFLEPMMLGRATFLDEREQQLLLEYLTYKTLILDVGFADPFIPPKAAQEFFSDRAMPEGMDLYILNCAEGEWQLGIRCVGGAFSREMSDPKMPPNVKSFAVGFGHLFVFAVFRKEGEFDYHFEPGVAVRLWPRFSHKIRWPTLKPINSAQAEFIAMSVWRGVEAPSLIDFGKG
jgi:hypothetical protein